MRRPSPELLLTLALVLVLAGAGVGVVLLGERPPTLEVSSPQGEEATPAPPSPSTHVPPSSSPTVRPSPGHGDRAHPLPLPSVTASVCPDLSEQVPLRVVSFNTHFGIGPDGFDLRRLAAAIKRWDADVVMLQEVDRFRRRSHYLDVPAELARRTGMEAAYGANVRRGRSEYGVATLSRHPIVLDTNVHLPNRPGLEQRGLLRTDIDIDGAVVSVFNTHLQNRVQSMRIRQLRAIRSMVLATEHPAVFGGDLNSGPGSPPMRVARSFARDVWADVPTRPSFTAPARSPRFRIDYVMYTPPLRVRSVAVMPDLISDHRAVRADLVVPVAGDEVCVPQFDRPVRGNAPRGGGAGGGN